MSDERDAAPAPDPHALAALSAGLKEAFARIAGADLSDEERARWQRRLVAVTNAAKRDLPRAEAQLERFDADWRRQVEPS